MKYIILYIAILSLAGCSEEMQKSAQDHQAHLQQEAHQYQLALQASQYEHERQMALEAGNHEQLMKDKFYAFAGNLFGGFTMLLLFAGGYYLFYKVSELISNAVREITGERQITQRYMALMATLQQNPPQGFEKMNPEERAKYCQRFLIQANAQQARVIDGNDFRRLQ